MYQRTHEHIFILHPAIHFLDWLPPALRVARLCWSLVQQKSLFLIPAKEVEIEECNPPPFDVCQLTLSPSVSHFNLTSKSNLIGRLGTVITLYQIIYTRLFCFVFYVCNDTILLWKPSLTNRRLGSTCLGNFTVLVFAWNCSELRLLMSEASGVVIHSKCCACSESRGGLFNELWQTQKMASMHQIWNTAYPKYTRQVA